MPLGPFQADTPTLDGLRLTRPNRWRTVKAHGTAVGLPSDDDMGNSEVLHNLIEAVCKQWIGDVLQIHERLTTMGTARSGHFRQSD